VTEYADDASIPDQAALWRRVPPWHFFFDENLGRIRPSKAAFDNDPDGSPMSVVLADLVRSSGHSPEHVLAGHPRFALAAIAAGLARSRQQRIVRDARPEEPAHALVAGKKTDSVKRAFAKACVWVVAPPEGTYGQDA
jgi:hypothetical protein